MNTLQPGEPHTLTNEEFARVVNEIRVSAQDAERCCSLHCAHAFVVNAAAECVLEYGPDWYQVSRVLHLLVAQTIERAKDGTFTFPSPRMQA